ncbi:hypothetical protein GC173_08060 [bacterium]|nr:hypothetical protein [bacterium]
MAGAGELNGKVARRAAFAAVLRKLKDGKKLTAADYRFLEEMEAEERAAAKVGAEKDGPGDANLGASLEEDLEEWILRDGVVRGRSRKLSAVAAMHQVPRAQLDKLLWKLQRGLLARYGFEGLKKTGALSGNEVLAMQWVKSIAQIARASQEWELQMEDAEKGRDEGKGVGLERFQLLVDTLKKLAEKRDLLAFKVRELAIKERKEVVSRKGTAGRMVNIVVNDGEL